MKINKGNKMRDITFGKYKGKLLEWVMYEDPDYIMWAIDNEVIGIVSNMTTHQIDYIRSLTFDGDDSNDINWCSYAEHC